MGDTRGTYRPALTERVSAPVLHVRMFSVHEWSSDAPREALWICSPYF